MSDDLASRMAEFKRTLAEAFDDERPRATLSVKPTYDREPDGTGPALLDGASITVEFPVK